MNFGPRVKMLRKNSIIQPTGNNRNGYKTKTQYQSLAEEFKVNVYKYWWQLQ